MTHQNLRLGKYWKLFWATLNDEDKIKYLLTLENENTSKIVGKYTYLMFQKRKDILHSKYN